MAERTNAAALKAAGPCGPEGSNPSRSAFGFQDVGGLQGCPCDQHLCSSSFSGVRRRSWSVATAVAAGSTRGAIRHVAQATTKRSLGPDGRVTVAGKVARCEGSIYLVEADGTWRATYYLTGERRPRSTADRDERSRPKTYGSFS